MTESFRLREQGNSIYKSINPHLAPVIKETRLKEALNFYNRALIEASVDLDKSSACKNVLIVCDSILT